MENFKLLCQRLEDIRQNQLDRVLESLRYFTLCPDNRDRTWTPEEFVDAVKEACRRTTTVRRQSFKKETLKLDIYSLFSCPGNSTTQLAIGERRTGTDRTYSSSRCYKVLLYRDRGYCCPGREQEQSVFHSIRFETQVERWRETQTESGGRLGRL